ncbi:hypothetical protein BFJ70_g1621 [Fusarium oxysporum]|uniref:Uncharacterized protein n=1 Tax=Fusarium oxysporum Fo47 TaxID=660027 RepID=W9K7F2_FUSOX|nr:uncharacterized protein FOBCDRAFT_202304 [Fusarium oxysporum Fo47]EWZ38674.1 hypothetical protein FOZG_10220 [Fusarium oxysporum Fo47]QKD55162.1 hypothetical protein FOBCDRAFT_202304 [Fusarium oxysporum Fo47]RKL50460.1 hypothetical protein BFJ70_g1621 [Fusarium oxysporum]
MEVKVEILRYVLPPMASPVDHGIHPQAAYVAAENLMCVSKEFKQVVEMVHCIKAVNNDDGKTKFTMDPMRDTLVVFWMALPNPNPNNSWIQSMKVAGYEVDDNALPIRRLIAHSPFPMQARSQDPSGFISRTNRAQTVANTLRWLDVPFETELPMFSHFPFLEEAVVSVSMMNRMWHISGFQMEGPDVVAPRENGESWGLNRVMPHNRAASRYFKAKGIEADTGISWELPPSVFSTNHGCLISQPEDIASHVDQNAVLMQPLDRPFIGLYGYSRGTRSLGGKWAGFRYHTHTHKVQFTPLAWHEVEPIVHRLGYNHHAVSRQLPGGSDPQFIARVWIIQEGTEPKNETHHCWVDVKEPEEYDEPMVTQIATT